METTITRRDLLRTGAMAGAALMAAAATPRALAAPACLLGARARRRVLRVAHLTDFHIEPERSGDRGVAACLHHMQSLDDKPELVLTGGDLIYDGFSAERMRTQALWDMFMGTVKRECGLPVEHCLGNHDIWGWNKKESKTSGDEPEWGKKWALGALGLPERYRSFERAGWKFVVLDSVHTDPANPDGYKARLDEEQMAWLKSELESADKSRPVLVLSHIPILSASALVIGNDTKSWNNVVSGSEMHLDCIELAKLFAAHGNVKVCLSGHMHKLDRVEYQGTTYICNGAVSGGWWKGPKDWCDEGYGVLDLYDDGTFENRYVTYGWKAVKE